MNANDEAPSSARPPGQAKDDSDPAQHSTQPARDGDPEPKLQHEKDLSHESQETGDGEPPEVGKQAHKDLERGLVDTDRGNVTDEVYNNKLKS